MEKIKYIFVTFEHEGIHHYPDAPEGVEFLKHPHRHVFHFRIDIEVFHCDRELEFILVKRQIAKWTDNGTMVLNNMSCEMIADMLHALLVDEYGDHRNIIIEVNEDNENGAKCFYPRK